MAAQLPSTSCRVACSPRPAHAAKPLRCLSGRALRSARCVRAHAVSYAEAELQPVSVDGQPTVFPAASGVYAVHDQSGAVKYVGISRTVSLSVQSHAKELGEEVVHSIKVGLVENATKQDLTDAWKQWLQQIVDATGAIPSGNAPGPEKEKWQPTRRVPVKQEIRLTSGKGAEDLTCDIKDLVDMVVKNERIVAFVKGTRTQPQCGFSYQMLQTLNTMKAEYEVVNVLDETFNPGLREAIKEYSAWPTIPQLYIEGEFVGGADIVNEMFGNGELAKLVRGIKD